MSASHLHEVLNKCAYIRGIVQNYDFEKFFMSKPAEHRQFLEDNPLASIIATICDWKISADDAWSIPYEMNRWLGQQNLSFDAGTIAKLGRERIRTFLEKFMERRWPSGMKREERVKWLDITSKWIVDTCGYIAESFGDVDQMFMAQREGRFVILTPQLVYMVLVQLPGVGSKKAAMIARDFAMASKLGIYNPMFEGLRKRMRRRGLTLLFKDEHFSEVPVDIHVARVFIRLGLLGRKASLHSGALDSEERLRQAIPELTPYIQNIARIIYPELPGLVDIVLWDVGRKHCRVYGPECAECPLNKACDYSKRVIH